MTDIRAICSLSDEELAARRKELQEGLLSVVRGREELSEGLALLFDATPERREELESFVAFERECCSDVDWSVRDVDGALRLEIRGIDPRTGVFAEIGLSRTSGSDCASAPLAVGTQGCCSGERDG